MSVVFMTEQEADEIIEKNMDLLVAKIECATQCSESAAGVGQTGQCNNADCTELSPGSWQCCGCCSTGSPGTEVWRTF